MISNTLLPSGFEIEPMLTGDHHCPVCEQQTYLRPVDLSSVLCHALRIISQRSSEGSITTGDDMARYGRTVYCNYTQLKYWGFIFEDRTAGGWRITPDGMNYLEGGYKVPKRLWVFADQVRKVPESMSFELIGIGDVKPYHPRSRQEAREQIVPLEYET